MKKLAAITISLILAASIGVGSAQAHHRNNPKLRHACSSLRNKTLVFSVASVLNPAIPGPPKATRQRRICNRFYATTAGTEINP